MVGRPVFFLADTIAADRRRNDIGMPHEMYVVLIARLKQVLE